MSATGTATRGETVVPGTSWRRQLDPVLEVLRSEEDAITAKAVGRLRAEIASYAPVTDTSLCDSAHRNTEQAVRVLRHRRVPMPDDLRADAGIAAQRASEGVPLEDALRAYRISLRAIAVAFARVAATHDLPAAIVAEGVDLLWQLTDTATVEIATAHRDAELRAARRDQHRRGRVAARSAPGHRQPLGDPDPWRRLPASSPTAGTTRSGDGSPTLPTSSACGPPCAIPTPAQKRRSWICTRDDVAGIVPTPPRLEGGWAVVAVGPATTLTSLEASFATASRVLDVAIRYGRTGGARPARRLCPPRGGERDRARGRPWSAATWLLSRERVRSAASSRRPSPASSTARSP